MAEETITDRIRADHDRVDGQFDEMERITEQFERGDEVFCIRAEKAEIRIRHGIINRIAYRSGEVFLNVAPSETENNDYTMGSRKWDFFEDKAGMYDKLDALLDPDGGEGVEPENTGTDTPTDGADTNAGTDGTDTNTNG